MAYGLKWDINVSGDVAVARLSGSLTQDGEVDALYSQLPESGKVIVHLGGVTRINSTGVRSWMRLLNRLAERAEVELQECPPIFVAQMNMIRGFTQGAEVVSVQAPFYCDLCAATAVEVLDVRDGAVPDLPLRRCEADGADMMFDSLPEIYFRFLTSE